MAARLRDFEGWRCLWRLPVAGILYAAVPLILLGATVAGAAIAGSEFNLRTAVVSAVVVLFGTGLVAPRLARRQLHRKIIAERLRSWQKPNPATEVQVLLPRANSEAARAALRRAGFNPGVYGLGLGSPPADAPDLDLKLAVQEPEAWPQSASDEDRTRRIVAVFRHAGLPARVGGVEVRP